MSIRDLGREHSDELVDRLGGEDDEARAAILVLIAGYESLAERDDDRACRVREEFLEKLKENPTLISEDEVSKFLAESVEPEDLTHLEWSGPDEVVAFSETLFSFPVDSEEVAKRVSKHVNELLRSELHRYEAERDYEDMFLLMQYAPTLMTISDAELFRLRHRSYLYELRRVRRNRRMLYSYLVVQTVLIFAVFPFLFVQAENGQIRETLEAVTNKDLPDEPAQYYTYADAVYWSLITAVSVGYGDIVPATTIGRFMAAILGLMGVTTIGIIAGLVLEWITPRRID